jgi:hypothetical protein
MNRAIQEIEHHLHNIEVWLEPRAVPVAGVTEAVVAGTRPAVAAPYFEIDAGNNAWGAWTCVLGSGDTPNAIGAPTQIDGYLCYDLHEIGVQTTERAAIHYIQFGFGTVAAGVLTGPYTTIWINPIATTGRSVSKEFKSDFVDVGVQCWARALCPNQNTAWIRFNYGMHFYL